MYVLITPHSVAPLIVAMTTLSKLGSKMEELMERNKLLSNLADMKSQHPSRGANYYSSGHSEMSSHLEYKPRGRDPSDKDVTRSYPASTHQHDDRSILSDMSSTIISYERPKKLEPEAASVRRESIREEEEHERRTYSGRDDNNSPLLVNGDEGSSEEPFSVSEPRLVKVKGGEYYGTLNKRGQKHGEGKMTYANGNEYEGRWMNNKRDGKGITKYASGNVYTGTWKEGKRHGFGVFHIKKTGDIYRGHWSQGLKSGPGVYEYEDGELDVSFYKDDMRVGEGVRWSASRQEASRLVDGQLVGEEGGMPVEEATRLTKHLGFVV